MENYIKVFPLVILLVCGPQYCRKTNSEVSFVSSIVFTVSISFVKVEENRLLCFWSNWWLWTCAFTISIHCGLYLQTGCVPRRSQS